MNKKLRFPECPLHRTETSEEEVKKKKLGDKLERYY
jgi:hypothetical protein